MGEQYLRSGYEHRNERYLHWFIDDIITSLADRLDRLEQQQKQPTPTREEAP